MSLTASTAFVPASAVAPPAQLRGAHALAEQRTAMPTTGAAGPSGPLGALAVAAAGAAAIGQARSSRRSRRTTRQSAASWIPGVETSEEKLAREEQEAAEAEAKRYAEFCASRDSLNLPTAVPVLGAPAYREFMYNVAGDNGFDPAGIVQNEKDFQYQRRAELTHGRFAMLAAVGWPLAELYHSAIAQEWGWPNALAAGGRAPSVLNGGITLFNDNGPTLESFFFAAVVWVAYAIENRFEETFDPLGLKGFTPPMSKLLPEGRSWMEEAEIKHCRLAMVAITAYVIEEVASKAPVTVETPYLFSSTF